MIGVVLPLGVLGVLALASTLVAFWVGDALDGKDRTDVVFDHLPARRDLPLVALLAGGAERVRDLLLASAIHLGWLRVDGAAFVVVPGVSRGPGEAWLEPLARALAALPTTASPSAVRGALTTASRDLVATTRAAAVTRGLARPSSRAAWLFVVGNLGAWCGLVVFAAVRADEQQELLALLGAALGGLSLAAVVALVAALRPHKHARRWLVFLREHTAALRDDVLRGPSPSLADTALAVAVHGGLLDPGSRFALARALLR